MGGNLGSLQHEEGRGGQREGEPQVCKEVGEKHCGESGEEVGEQVGWG